MKDPIEIYLTRRRRVFVGDRVGQSPPEVVATVAKEMEQLGFVPSRDLFESLLARPPFIVAGLWTRMEPVLRKMTGAHRTFRPFYPDFPAQVMEASIAELYVNALLHYWTGGALRPDGEESARPELADKVELKEIGLGSAEDFERIFTDLAGANASLSQDDKDVLAWFADHYGADCVRLLPAEVPQKETLAYLVALLLPKGAATHLIPKIQTATDVLRVACALSGGDVSLAAPTKFRRFKRGERRFLLAALDACGLGAVEDVLRWRERWKRLARELRAGDYAGRFPAARRAIAAACEDMGYRTFDSLVEEVIASPKCSTSDAVNQLSLRPGVFARRLDHAMRTSFLPPVLVAGFAGVAANVSTPVLVQLHAHFATRPVAGPPFVRSFFPKGQVAKMKVVEDALVDPISRSDCDRVVEVARAHLVARFAGLPPLGKVFVDPALRSMMVPFGMRSAAKSLRTVARGSRLDLPDADTIRMFLWWKDGTGRTDIDLSAVLYDEAWGHVADVAYYNLRESGCTHSGDIVSAPQGAAEFIDLHVPTLTAPRAEVSHEPLLPDRPHPGPVRYVVMVLNSFTQQPYCELPECFAGWMGRERPETGRTFDARTVADRIDLAADTQIAVPLIFDLVARKAIWADLALKSRPCSANNVHRNGRSLATMARGIATLRRPNLYDLFAMHAEARGRMVLDREEAECVFAMDGDVTPFDADRIRSEYLAG